MSDKISVLDCTLRDGGYCNQWKFGLKNERKIVDGLLSAGIDIVECGLLCDEPYECGISRFQSVSNVQDVLPKYECREGRTFVCLMNVGEFDVENLPRCNGQSITGIRVAFHKKDVLKAVEICKRIKEKGYLVFVQPMVSLRYSEEEFCDLIYMFNEVEPYAFYIVDSFGSMKRDDALRLYYLVEQKLKEEIKIGFHSHNNLQLAFSNAQALIEIETGRERIIDCSIMGMGRGAGNLNTELFIEYLNSIDGKRYKVDPILYVIDDVISVFYQRKNWGYSLPNYLSAVHDIHPNYAGFLSEKNTLTIHDMNELLSMIEEGKGEAFNREYIESLYKEYMNKPGQEKIHLNKFKAAIKGKKILLIAPGKSCMEETDLIGGFSRLGDVISISVNFEYDCFKTDYIFVSNLKRFKELQQKDAKRLIVTSNIDAVNVYLKINYAELLCELDMVEDNAAMMLIKLLIKEGAEEIYLAGLDGYGYDVEQNYALDTMQLATSKGTLDEMNKGMTEMLQIYAKQCKLYFLTKQKYLRIKGELL